ncbi:MAG: sensor histidine kinase [Betaproteobacteria bacterium]|nr:sensor histidine kinase [Betaproteobacteria bacterium]
MLARRLVEAEELERHRIAGELHDRVGQTLSAININLDIALGLLPPDNVEVRMRIADSLALVEGTLQAIEHLMAELRPPLLDEYGLGAALGFLAKGFSARTGVACAVEDPHEVGRSLPRDAAVALFRIAQEALANVFKHAAARHARIRLEAAPGGVRVEIADDGSGFDRRERLAQHHRWGMTTMQERAAAVGGRIEVESAPGAGTLVRAWVPLAGPAQGGSA